MQVASGVFAKDLSKVDPDLSRVLLIDNTVAALQCCPGIRPPFH
jgi:hypothetical protein